MSVILVRKILFVFQLSSCVTAQLLHWFIRFDPRWNNSVVPLWAIAARQEIDYTSAVGVNARNRYGGGRGICPEVGWYVWAFCWSLGRGLQPKSLAHTPTPPIIATPSLKPCKMKNLKYLLPLVEDLVKSFGDTASWIQLAHMVGWQLEMDHLNFYTCDYDNCVWSRGLFINEFSYRFTFAYVINVML